MTESLDDYVDQELEVNVLRDMNESNDVVVPEAILHDITKWPHMYDDEMREYMFPTAVAAPEVESVSNEDLHEHARLHQRWAAHRASVSRG